MRTLVYGFGSSGRAATELLLSQGAGVLVVDDSDEFEACEKPGWVARPSAKVEFRQAASLPTIPSDIETVIRSPGVPSDRPLLGQARAQGVSVISEVELGYRYLEQVGALAEGGLVAITGSNGKSTTTALVGHLLRRCGHQVEVCGNIGEPLTSKVRGAANRLFVVELSSFQLEDTDTFRPSAAALLNLSPDHLDRYPTFAEYAGAKQRIFERMTSGTAVLNADDPLLLQYGPEGGVRRRLFSSRKVVEDGGYLRGDRVVEADGRGGEETIFGLEDVSLVGLHNLENAMAAMLLARTREPRTGQQGTGEQGTGDQGTREQDRARLAAALSSFRGLPHRCELVREVGGVRWFNDSKATNVGACVSALRGFSDGSVHLILGGRNKDSDPSELVDMVRRKACEVYLIGEAALLFAASLDRTATVHHAGTLERAVELAAKAVRPGEVVLLSPACASFDQFDSFEHRGDCFRTLVEQLREGDGG